MVYRPRQSVDDWAISRLQRALPAEAAAARRLTRALRRIAPGARADRGRPPLRAPLNLRQILGHSLRVDRWEPAVLLRLFD